MFSNGENIDLTMHELEKLIDNSLQEFPMGSQKSWILSHDVHNVTGNYSFVVFALFLFAQTE